MKNSLFNKIEGLDAGYLDAAYGDDAETAAMVFEQFLEELPSNLARIEECVSKQDLENFKHHIHKQKPGYSYVGLTDVTAKFHELQITCLTMEDMSSCRDEIDRVLARIRSAQPVLQKTLAHLKNQ